MYTDLYKKYYNEGTSVARNAIAMDKAGNYDMAKTFYLQAISKYKLALQQKEISDMMRNQINENINKCTHRVEELDDIIRSSEVDKAGGAGSVMKTKKGGPSTGKDDQAESNEFINKMENSILIEKPDIKWSDVAGLQEAKRALVDTVINPIKFAKYYTGDREPWKAILLYGPPGTGKSFLAKATASEANQSTFLTVSTSDLTSKWVGESEKLIRALFETARKHTPAIIFIDEIDSILSNRTENDSEASRRMKTEFLIQLDGVGKSMDGILLLAATNIPWDLDPAVRRRFEKRIYIPLPDIEAREGVLMGRLKKNVNNLTPDQVKRLAAMTEGFSCSDLKNLSRQAAHQTMRKFEAAQFYKEVNGEFFPCPENTPGCVKMNLHDPNFPIDKVPVPPITFEDFKDAMHKAKSSVSPKDIQQFEEWTALFGEEGN
ncbi:ATPase, AAA family protein [Trichomonas vaginalis G3]|uniref:ATPase, AAA family protein n=1 Tax=Trichomonas vaginalis (strain ATCC PRA-98 / G3) TaxID=412133 RepID=A2DHC0_TRIV3|nr:positive regulation of centriole elongation [Trichomonas vaginalis G3]EAY20193.1 ATPase, AAA family protein [Trichomonas vaginalis G3]KAI5507676.1 positive regulation of centriole elongation [Trichomonas vaginalis G3]|eukprot:XP_001581179.1 ATPase, AAA family protein [Trichomonas vaginalis G3]